MAIVTVAIFYGLLQKATSRQAFWLGWLFGLGYFGIGVHWVYFSMHLFGAAIAPIAAALTLVFVLVMTLFPAGTAYLWVRLRRNANPLTNAGLFAALWVLSELLRGKLMGGFPWILVGYSQTTGPLGTLAPWIGVYGLSLLVLFIGCALIALLQTKFKAQWRPALALCVPVLTALGLGNVSVSEPIGEPIGVRMVQANIPQEMKFSTKRLRNSLTLYTQMTRQDDLSGINLVVWPETAIPTYFDQVDQLLQPFVSDMEAQNIDVLSGGFHREGEDVYNAVRQLGGDRALYEKRHLVPFGEFMPLRFLLDFAARYIEIPMSDLSVGREPYEPLALQNTQVGVSICYEDVYGEEMRALLPEAQMLVNVSNDAWFGNSAAPHQHEQKARMRAREFARPLVRVTNTGVSSAIDHEGRILGRIAHNTGGILDVSIQPRTGYTLYAKLGNWPVFGLSLGWVLLLVWGRFSLKTQS